MPLDRGTARPAPATAALSSGLATGSMASRRASPKRFRATTTMVTTSPGQSTVRGKTLMNLTEVVSECPQEGRPEGTPTPR